MTEIDTSEMVTATPDDIDWRTALFLHVIAHDVAGAGTFYGTEVVHVGGKWDRLMFTRRRDDARLLAQRLSADHGVPLRRSAMPVAA
jgi:hypothetical protein